MCTCFAISARTNRGTPVSIDCRFLKPPCTNRLVSRSCDLIAGGSTCASFSLSSWCCVFNSVSCIRRKFDNPMLVIASVQLGICCSICLIRRRGVRLARCSCRCPERQDHLDAGKLKPLKDTQRIDAVTAEAGLCQSFLGNFVHCCCFWSDSFLFALVGGAWRSRNIRLVVH